MALVTTTLVAASIMETAIIVCRLALTKTYDAHHLLTELDMIDLTVLCSAIIAIAALYFGYLCMEKSRSAANTYMAIPPGAGDVIRKTNNILGALAVLALYISFRLGDGTHDTAHFVWAFVAGYTGGSNCFPIAKRAKNANTSRVFAVVSWMAMSLILAMLVFISLILFFLMSYT